MLTTFILTFAAAVCVSATIDSDLGSSSETSVIYPEIITSMSDLTFEQAEELNQLLSENGVGIDNSVELVGKDDGSDVYFNAILDQYQRDLANLGSSEMVRENRLSYATFEDEIPPEVPVLNGDFDIEKRGHATFMAARRTPDAVEWQTKSFPAAGCIGRISHGIEKANYLSWRVSDLSCKFALFNFNMCMGQRTFDTRGFNVVSDGSRYNHGFKSVFFVCK